MIYSISGILKDKKPTSAVVDIQGIGFLLHIPLSTYEQLPAKGNNCHLLTYFHVREDIQALYGFSTSEEKEFFTLLISISGIGPRLAIGMMSGTTVEDFRSRIVSGDVKSLTALPGIGQKTAKRLIVELKEKFIESSEDDMTFISDPAVFKGVMQDAFLALISLGYRNAEASRALGMVQKKYPEVNAVQDIIKLALKTMRKV